LHQKSDHTINGNRYELEAQIMFKSDDASRAGKRAMVSVLFHVEVDERNPVLEQFIWNMTDGYMDMSGPGGLDLSKMFVDKNANKNALKLNNVVKFD
jgi:hypothetical protein